MTTRTDAVIHKLYKLNRGDRYVYHNSGTPGRDRRVFAKAMELSDAGRLQLSQKRLDDGTLDYIATGLMSDLDKQRAGVD